MPKWTENRMVAAAADLQQLLNGEGDFDFNIVRPLPVEYAAVVAEAKRAGGDYIPWFLWSLDSWGTKWNAFETAVERYGRFAVIRFKTAWSEPDHEMLSEFAALCSTPIWFEYAHESFDGVHAMAIGNDGAREPRSDHFLMHGKAWGDDSPLPDRAVDSVYDEATIARHLR